MENFERLLKKFDELQLQENEYVIIGSAALAVRNIRDSNDLDILVLPKTYENLLEKYYDYEHDGEIIWQGLDISYKLKGDFSEADFFSNSEIINGYRFLTLEKLLDFKQSLGREKDEADIILIQQYLTQIVAGDGAQMVGANMPII